MNKDNNKEFKGEIKFLGHFKRIRYEKFTEDNYLSP